MATGTIPNPPTREEFNALNSNIENLDKTADDLGSRQNTGEISLSSSIQNYRFIQVRVGYYASGYSNFGSLVIPVSTINVNSDSVYAYRVVCYANNTVGFVDVHFKENAKVQVTVNTLNGSYVRITGIK